MARKRRSEPVPEPDPEGVDFPEDGDLHPEGGGDPGDEDDPPKPDPKPDPLAELTTRMETMQRTHAEEMAALRRTIPPVEAKKPADPELKKTNWNDLLFTDPEKAVAQIKAEAVKEAEDKMTASYQKDQGTKKFWDGFYDTNKDLKDDHDLVELTLNSNLSALANIPVADAMKKLADLTRERMLRYSGGVKPRGKKAFAEGSGTPSRKAAEEEHPDVTSLSEIIRARRLRRRASAA